MKHQLTTSLLLRRQRREGGFSMVVALVTLFTLMLGGTLLASRSTLSLFSGAFNRQSQKARNAAESGTAYFTSTLNQPNNRWLMVVRNGDPDFNDSNSKDLWINRSITANNPDPTVVELRQNPCYIGTTASDQPDYSKLDPNNAATKSSGYQEWFISDNGSITSTPGNATESFRLLSIKRQEYAGNIGAQEDINGDGVENENDRWLSVWRDKNENPSGVGKIILEVEGRHYVGSTIASSAILESELELTPKCCQVPFGGKHGNVDYASTVDSTTGAFINKNTICVENNLGLGILAGARLNDTGSITIKGKSTEIEGDDGVPISPIYCLASLVSGCTIENKDPSIGVEIIDPELPDVYTFCDNPTSGFDCGAQAEPSPLAFIIEKKKGNTISGMVKDWPEFVSESTSGSGYVLNAGVEEFDQISGARNLPEACVISDDDSELHCNVEYIEVPSGQTILRFDTSKRKVRLYFPVSGTLLRDGTGKKVAGGGEIQNCNVSNTGQCNPPGSITDLSMFGSTSETQDFFLTGTSATTSYFLYLPSGDLELAGTADFTGVVWANTLGSTGNPTWTVPADGLVDVFSLMNQRWSNWNASEIEPIFMDFLARSINRHRWKSQ